MDNRFKPGMNKNSFAIALLIATVVVGLFSSSTVLANSSNSNQLKNHPAPYLALHGDDPVFWQQWNADVVERAKAENKILFVSIGYFACHWCHVMQQESYQDDEVAGVLNRNFVSVKIDRELEPAIDERLMNFAQSTLGRGGWPLNVFLTPEGHPIFAVLYAPKGRFLQVLNRLQGFWDADPDKVRGLVLDERRQRYEPANPDLNVEELELLIDRAPEKMLARADFENGGFGDSSKFPSVPQLRFLLQQYKEKQSPRIKKFLETTLDSMALYGMRDHLAEGFFRYTVDASWEIPHFEKMLYDNAGLADLYMHAADVLDRRDYHQTARGTLDFMRDSLWLDEALVASFSAVDDDSVEGGHYLWNQAEVRQLLNENELAVVNEIWGLDRAPELEAGTLPRWDYRLDEYALTNNLPVEEVMKTLDAAAAKLLVTRTTRSLPVDDKLLAGWNGLALVAFANAFQRYRDEAYQDTAAALAQFLMKRMWDGKQLIRARAKGEVQGTASIEDYAYVSAGLWAWGQAIGDPKVLSIAEKITREGWRRFYKETMWFREDGSLLAPPTGIAVMEDGAVPSPAAWLTSTALKIALKNSDKDWLQTIRATVNRGQRDMAASPYWFVSQMLVLKEVIDAGEG